MSEPFRNRVMLALRGFIEPGPGGPQDFDNPQGIHVDDPIDIPIFLDKIEEAAAQAEGSLDPKPTHIWNGVDGHDCQDCPPDSMWKCDWYAHGGLPTEHGIPVRTVAEQRRDADKFVNSLPLPTSGAEGSLDVERLVTEAVNAWIDDDTPGLDEKEWRVGLVNAVVARLAAEKPR